MKVKELIALLERHDPELKIAMAGYEGGFYEPTFTELSPTKLNLDIHKEWYYGPHEIPDFCHEEGPYKQDDFLILS